MLRSWVGVPLFSRLQMTLAGPMTQVEELRDYSTRVTTPQMTKFRHDKAVPAPVRHCGSMVAEPLLPHTLESSVHFALCDPGDTRSCGRAGSGSTSTGQGLRMRKTGRRPAHPAASPASAQRCPRHWWEYAAAGLCPDGLRISTMHPDDSAERREALQVPWRRFGSLAIRSPARRQRSVRPRCSE